MVIYKQKGYKTVGHIEFNQTKPIIVVLNEEKGDLSNLPDLNLKIKTKH